jgi:ATP-binding cassette, subfamily B, bacterial HlyB/CyaB
VLENVEASLSRPPVESANDPLPPPNRDSGLQALALLAASLGLTLDPDSVGHELGILGRLATVNEMLYAAAKSGMQLRVLSKQARSSLDGMRRPYLLRRRNGQFRFIVPARRQGYAYVVDPGTPQQDQRGQVPLDSACTDWSGDLLIVLSHTPPAESAGFGLHWFVQIIWRYRAPFVSVLIASCFLQLFALATPLLFQVVIDKVLVHQSASTLTVIVVALVLIGFFDVVLHYLRTYVLAHTSNRLLFKLPLAYFDSRPTGQTVARVRELENIRSFFTGQSLTAIIDVMFALIFIAVLTQYSLVLTLIVTASLPFYVLIAAIFRPVLRRKLIERYNLGAATQQLLVESIVGAHTIKSAAAEPLVERQWSDRLAAYLKASFQAQLVASGGQNFIQYLNKLMTALLLFFGAKEVMAGQLTVGGLVAFNMISGQIFSPILRLSQLWQDFQQTQVSVDRVGDIFRTAAEDRPLKPRKINKLDGAIQFHDVCFRYITQGPYVLTGINLKVPAGQVLGIVGLSGSGKSTLAKLMQRMYVPDRGKITVDGIDIAQLDPYWLRRQIGVVLQENLLFNRSVMENIAFGAPHLDPDALVEIAKVAGADEFISKMPDGYDSQIVERGANLSGGQRQRIAIARALARNPKILILDEATSALDYQSERIIRDNMQQIGLGRTVIVIAHRLAAVRDCDRIICLSDGRIIEDGTPEQLAHANGLYAYLLGLQNSGAER